MLDSPIMVTHGHIFNKCVIATRTELPLHSNDLLTYFNTLEIRGRQMLWSETKNVNVQLWAIF